MPLYQVVVLAILQSLTEFLPISSTAHLALAPWLLGWNNPELNSLGFDVALHIGTLAAIVLYFFRDWLELFAGAFGLRSKHDPEIGRNPKLLWLLALASVPVGVLGVVFSKQAETTWRSPFVMGAMLIGVGVVMYIAERTGRFQRNLGSVSLGDSLVIGLSQALAIVPGTSRSGITISTGLMRGLDRPAAARFSFLLSTPALAAAAAKHLWDLRHSATRPEMLPFLVGVLVSAVTGWLVIAFFLRFLRSHTLRFFVYYRVIFGIIVIALAIFSSRTAG